MENTQKADLVTIVLAELQEASAKFEKEVEKTGGFYDMALGLVRAGYEIEGCVLILATWNLPRFRWVVSDFDVDGFKNAMSELRGDFAVLGECSIQDIDLAQHCARIEGMFDKLKPIKGVEYTGATKVMHLKQPKLFVPWDQYISGHGDKKYYKNLPCVTSRKWSPREYAQNGSGYVEFLSDMQSRFAGLRYPSDSERTLAKAIDEFHYLNVTGPILRMAKAKPIKFPVGTKVRFRKWDGPLDGPMDRIGTVVLHGRKWITIRNEATTKEDWATVEPLGAEVFVQTPKDEKVSG